VSDPAPSFFTRLSLAFGAFFRILSDAEFALRVGRAESRDQPPAPARQTAAPPRVFREAPPDSALQLLGLLQQEGRFIDFLQEDIEGYSDADVGAAARVVHGGCRKAIHDHFKIVPIRTEEEGSRLTLKEGFDPSTVRLTGNVVGKPPFTGNLVHRGWRVSEVMLPKVAEGHDTRVIASAEVEL
jgi:hypothetical protein